MIISLAEVIIDFFSVLDDARIDLLSISNFIYAADRRIPRSSAKDGWTREINMTIYVLLLEEWKVAQKVLEEMLSFLLVTTGQ